VEERVLRLFDAYLNEVGIEHIAQITSAVIEEFLLGRPRARPRSFNHLVGVVSRLFEWMVEHEIIDHSPVTTHLRRPGQNRIPFIFDLPTAQRLIDVASQLPDTNKGPLRGITYATIFSLLFGLGLRVGEVSRLCLRDIDRDRNILTLRETKFSKSRLVPMGPRLADRLCAFLVTAQVSPAGSGEPEVCDQVVGVASQRLEEIPPLLLGYGGHISANRLFGRFER
jgi:site-specific recombinase XerD